MNFRETDKKNIISFIVGVIVIIWYFFLPVSAIAAAAETSQSIVQQENVGESEGYIEIIEVIEVDEVSESEVSESTESLVPTEEEVVKYQSDASAAVSFDVPNVNTNFKSFTYYTSLNRSSTQWRLQEKAYTDSNGLRKIENYYLAAVGTYYSSTIGDLFRFTTDCGNTFDIIVCDIKSNAHTDSRNMYTRGNCCMVEFYVAKTLCKTARVRGSIGVLSGFEGSIVKVEKLGRYNWE